jgi:cell division cycle 14
MLAPGLFSHTPKDYLEVFRHKRVSAVVRLNSKEYDRQEFIRAGIKHFDLFFEDCTVPTDALVHRFFAIMERETGVVAVHCLAGLGRTGTLIALWIMTRHGFTADEAIGYLRIVRPGSVIGPQQQYLRAAEGRAWRCGAASGGGVMRADGAEEGGDGAAALSPSSAAASAQLAEEVAQGMLRKHTIVTGAGGGGGGGLGREGRGRGNGRGAMMSAEDAEEGRWGVGKDFLLPSVQSRPSLSLRGRR